MTGDPDTRCITMGSRFEYYWRHAGSRRVCTADLMDAGPDWGPEFTEEFLRRMFDRVLSVNRLKPT